MMLAEAVETLNEHAPPSVEPDGYDFDMEVLASLTEHPADGRFRDLVEDFALLGQGALLSACRRLRNRGVVTCNIEGTMDIPPGRAAYIEPVALRSAQLVAARYWDAVHGATQRAATGARAMIGEK